MGFRSLSELLVLYAVWLWLGFTVWFWIRMGFLDDRDAAMDLLRTAAGKEIMANRYCAGRAGRWANNFSNRTAYGWSA